MEKLGNKSVSIRMVSVEDRLKKKMDNLSGCILSRSPLILMGFILVITAVAIGCIEEKSGIEEGANVTPIPEKTPEAASPGNDSQISPRTEKMMEKYSLDNLILMADSIIIGEVTNISPSKWNTQDGKKPVSGNNTYIIYTDVDVNVEEYLKNPTNDGVIVIRVLGGTAGEDALEVEDQPSFNMNEKLLLFLREDEDPRTKSIGSGHFVIAGLQQGKIPIPNNGEVIIGDEKISLNELRIIITEKGEKTESEDEIP